MQKNDLLKKGDSIIRILAMDGECALIMNCMHPHMPKWLSLSELDGYAPSTEKDLYEATGTVLYDIEALDASARKAAYERYTVIAGILPYLADESRRAEAIHIAAERFERTEMTVRKYLCRYLVFDSVSALAPKPTATEKELTQTEKVIRWGLNKFYYTAKKHSLRQSYTLLLKEKFCDETGQLKESYPTFSQYRYFYYTKYRDIRKCNHCGAKFPGNYYDNYVPLHLEPTMEESAKKHVCHIENWNTPDVRVVCVCGYVWKCGDDYPGIIWGDQNDPQNAATVNLNHPYCEAHGGHISYSDLITPAEGHWETVWIPDP